MRRLARERIAARRAEPARAEAGCQMERAFHPVPPRALDEGPAFALVAHCEAAEQLVDVEQIAQPPDEIGVVHEVHHRVQRLIARAQHVEGRSRHSHRIRSERIPPRALRQVERWNE